jgi:hypothetical protein
MRRKTNVPFSQPSETSVPLRVLRATLPLSQTVNASLPPFVFWVFALQFLFELWVGFFPES